MKADSVQPVRSPARVWLGAPNSIKGPTEAVFQRQSGNNLLIVGQRDEAALTMLWPSPSFRLAAQYPLGGRAICLLPQRRARFARSADFLDRIIAAVPHEVTVAADQDIAEVMNELAADIENAHATANAGEAPSIFLFIHGLQKFKKLRQEDEFQFLDGRRGSAVPARS